MSKYIIPTLIITILMCMFLKTLYDYYITVKNNRILKIEIYTKQLIDVLYNDLCDALCNPFNKIDYISFYNKKHISFDKVFIYDIINLNRYSDNILSRVFSVYDPIIYWSQENIAFIDKLRDFLGKWKEHILHDSDTISIYFKSQSDLDDFIFQTKRLQVFNLFNVKTIL